MKLLSHKAHVFQLLAISLFTLTFLLVVSKSQPLAQDGDELPGEMTGVNATQGAAPASGSITGQVFDPKTNPVKGVEVRAPGHSVVITNGNGEFNIRGVSPTERLPVSFSAPGFMDTTRIYEVGVSRRITGNVVVIWPRTASASLDAKRGGKLTFPGGFVSLPPNALVDELGRQLRGNVRVSFSALDVSDRRQIRSVPGDFTARMRNKTIRQLETFGVFEVFVEDSNGRRVNLAKGRKATVELSIPPAHRRTAPNIVGLFSFDRNSGLWIEEGTLRRTPGRASYISFVPNLIRSWNADNPLKTTCLKLQILDENGVPAPLGTKVEAEGVNYTGLSPTVLVTDATGEVCLLVKKCAKVSVTAYHPTIDYIQSCPLEFSTHCYTASASDCSNLSICPVETTTIQIAGGAFVDNLNILDTARWEIANGWANDSPFNVCWLANNIPPPTGSILALRLDDSTCPAGPNFRPFASGEYRTKTCYRYGTYEANFKAAAGPGLVTSFFVYTGTFGGPQHHEIDVEIFGKDTYKLQTNYYVAGVTHPMQIQLWFDASTGFHTYKIDWKQSSIDWYVDNVLVRPVTGSVPSLPGKIMVNLWAADNSIVGQTFGSLSYSGPIYAYYDWIQYSP